MQRPTLALPVASLCVAAAASAAATPRCAGAAARDTGNPCFNPTRAVTPSLEQADRVSTSPCDVIHEEPEQRRDVRHVAVGAALGAQMTLDLARAVAQAAGQPADAVAFHDAVMDEPHRACHDVGALAPERRSRAFGGRTGQLAGGRSRS